MESPQAARVDAARCLSRKALPPFLLEKNVALCASGIHQLSSLLQTVSLDGLTGLNFSFAFAHVLPLRHILHLDFSKLFEHGRFVVCGWRQQRAYFFLRFGL
jgi:hypothetical protein